VEDIVQMLDRVLDGPTDEPAIHVHCPRNILQYAKEDILRLRAFTSPSNHKTRSTAVAAELREFMKLKAAEDAFIGDRRIIDALRDGAAEIERLLSLTGPVSFGPTASEIYAKLRHPADAEMCPLPGQSAEADGH
jgi:hypothetical protein